VELQSQVYNFVLPSLPKVVVAPTKRIMSAGLATDVRAQNLVNVSSHPVVSYRYGTHKNDTANLPLTFYPHTASFR